VLVFAYELGGDEPVADVEELWTWQGRRYALRAIAAVDYRLHMRVRSRRWGTVTLPAAEYRRLARPVHDFLGGRRQSLSLT
jgi:hypothetical protein